MTITSNVIFLLLLPLVVNAHSRYKAKSPNGDKSPGGSDKWGHANGGSANQGTAVTKDGPYNTAICLADSDTDEYSNGEELGDACCYGWTSGNVDATKGALSSGGTDARISNPRLVSSKPTWSTAPINTGEDIKKYHTADPESFTVTSAERSVRIFCSNYFHF